MNLNAAATPFPYSGPEELREPIVAALHRVVDPEVAMTIVDVSSKPAMIGSLRPSVADPVRRMMPSDNAPPTSTPSDAPM